MVGSQSDPEETGRFGALVVSFLQSKLRSEDRLPLIDLSSMAMVTSHGLCKITLRFAIADRVGTLEKSLSDRRRIYLANLLPNGHRPRRPIIPEKTQGTRAAGTSKGLFSRWLYATTLRG